MEAAHLAQLNAAGLNILAAVHATLIPSQQPRDGEAQRGESQRIGVPAGYFRATQRFQLYSGVEYSGEWATATAVGRYGLPLVAVHALRSKRGCIVVVVFGVGALHGRGEYAVSEDDSCWGCSTRVAVLCSSLFFLTQ